MLVRLGPFQLDKKIAHGGMGHIWSGVHAATDTPVALKFLVHEGAKKFRFRTAFRNEVRAVAGLNHPNIAQVYDHGEVDGSVAAELGEGIEAGAPWLAMELVSGGTLHDLRGRLRWLEVRHIALCLLDALAHAHARGVIHRDLKPSNVLVRWGGSELPKVTLTDFGLAQAFEDTAAGEAGHFFGGTPSYMAPEQFDGRWRDFGPWTDLYGLGCLLWCLIKGKPPFGSKGDFQAKRKRHLREPVPELEPPFTAPSGLQTWLKRLLAKDPSHRYRRAADAAHGLLQLGPAPPGSMPLADITDTLDPPSAMDTLVLDVPSESLQIVGEEETLTLAPSDRGEVGLALHSDSSVVPPFPPDWRRASDKRPASEIGAGLALLGLRTIPMVGRESERSTLWGALREVAESGSARAVVLRGPAGAGKSRLAEWLSGRAHEVGVATPLRAEHSPIPGAGLGLGPMLSRFLRCQGMEREKVLERVEQIFRQAGIEHPDEWRALTELIAPSGEAGIQFRSSTERYVTVRRLLGGLCLERPVVVWLDDVQWGRDALGFTQYMLARSAYRALPVLLLLTGTDEALAERRDEAKLLAEILDREDVDLLEIGPLPQSNRTELIQRIVRLEPRLNHQVDQRVRGNPQFAVQLVTDWVERDLLIPGDEGYRLVDGADVRLPEDVRALWAGRVRRLLSTRSAAEGRALELAAILGSEVDPAEWRQVCSRSTSQGPGREADPSDSLLEALLDQRFARCGPQGPSRGWTFAHAMLRESLVSRAQEFSRYEEHHTACAATLQDQLRGLKRLDWRLAERLGRHFASAGEYESAAGPLLDAADARALCGDYAIAERLLVLRDEALERANTPESDERWGLGWLVHHRVQTGYGHYDEGTLWLQRLEDGNAAHDWPVVQVRTWCLRGEVHRLAGDYPAALQVLTNAEVAARRMGDSKLTGDVRFRVATVLMEHGDLSGAEQWCRHALSDYEAADYDVGAARAWQTYGQITMGTGRHDQAGRLLREAELRFERAGDRWGMASAINSQADVCRYQGQLTQAVELYRRARGLFRAIGSASWIFPHYNLGQVHLQRREFAQARTALEEALPLFTKQGHRRAQTDVIIGLAAVAASERRWLLYDDQLDEAAGALRATASADEDTARLLSLTGDICVSQQEPKRGIQAYSLARGQWKILGRDREVRHLDTFMAQLEQVP